MKKFIKERYLISLGVWFVVYMGLFLYLEICEPESVHLIFCGLDRRIPYLPVFIYLAARNLGHRDYRRAVLILTAGMNAFLILSYVWPTGLDLREGISYDTSVLSGRLMQFVQGVDTPKSVFPSMHVYVTLVLQYTLELQKGQLPMGGIRTGRLFAVAIILSTLFTRQHSVLDVLGAFLLFGILAAGCCRPWTDLCRGKFWEIKTARCVDKQQKIG